MLNIKIVLLVLLCFIIFATLIYPTAYYYTSLKISDSEFPVKINRITGEAKMLTTNGWRDMNNDK